MNLEVDLKIVGQMVSAISLLPVYPSYEKAGEFLVALLEDIPGCLRAGICFRRSAGPAGVTGGGQCRDCAVRRERLGGDEPYPCALDGTGNIRAYPFETAARLYGYFVLTVGDAAEFSQYEPFLKNLANILALTLENRQQQQELRASAEMLEQRIKERTDELNVSEQIFREFMEHSPVYVFFKDADIRAVRLSRNYETMLGKPMSELLGRSMDDLFPSELAKSMVTDDMRILKEGKEIIVEEELNGRRYKTIKFPLRIEGKPPYLAGYTLDITESKQAEDALRINDERYRKAQSMGHVGNWEYNLQTGHFWGSDEAKRIYGFDPEQADFTADEVESCIPERESVHQALVDLIEKGKTYELEFEIHPRNSSEPRIIASIAELQRDEHGEPLKVVGVIQDITWRKRAEEALRRHAQRLQILHETDQAVLKAVKSPEAIVQAALQHISALLQCQNASVGLFDADQKEARVFATNTPGETAVQAGKSLSAAAYGDLGLLREGRMEVREDSSGEGRARSYINAPLTSEGKLTGALRIDWDTPRAITPEEKEIAGEVAAQIAIAIEQSRLLGETRRYAAELERRIAERTAQLEATNKELEAFSYSVSHDLRAPLRAVDGYTAMLLEDYASRLDDEGKRVCGVISESARNMGRLIDDLLAFSRAGRTDMQASAIDMAAMAKAIYYEITSPGARERIDFQLDQLPPAVADPALLRQVWRNLISNAVKFSSKSEKAIIKIRAEQREDETIYSVKDDGAGFDMQYVNKLFGVFQRLHSTKEFEGTGVGLAIVQRIVVHHGGRVWAEGETGKGATLYFTLGKGDRSWIIQP